MRLLILAAGVIGAIAGAALLGYSLVNSQSLAGAALLLPGSIWTVGGLILIGIAQIIAQLEALADVRPAAAPVVRAKLPVPEPKPAEPKIAVPGPAETKPEVPKPAEAKPVAPPPAVANGNAPTGGDKTPPAAKPPEKAEKKVPPLSTPHGAGPAAAAANTAPAIMPPMDDLARAVENALLGEPKVEPKLEAPKKQDAAPPVVAVPPPSLKPPVQEAPPIIVRAPAAAPSQAPPLPGLDRSDALAPPRDDEASAPPASDKPPVLKSGVIEGMAYTLYADGSVDAELPTGMMHFVSIGDWRAHMRGET
jgi:hypothetical protein